MPRPEGSYVFHFEKFAKAHWHRHSLRIFMAGYSKEEYLELCENNPIKAIQIVFPPNKVNQ